MIKGWNWMAKITYADEVNLFDENTNIVNIIAKLFYANLQQINWYRSEYVGYTTKYLSML
jgi:hypothetical protein